MTPAQAQQVSNEVQPSLAALANIEKSIEPANLKLKVLVASIQQGLAEAKQRGDSAADLVRLYSRLRTAQDIIMLPFKDLSNLEGMLAKKLIPEAFDREQLKTLTTVDGDRVTTTMKLYASIQAAKRAEAYEWLRANGHEAMIAETVNASSLSAFAKAEVAEGRELPEEIFTVHIEPAISLTRAKK